MREFELFASKFFHGEASCDPLIGGPVLHPGFHSVVVANLHLPCSTFVPSLFSALLLTMKLLPNNEKRRLEVLWHYDVLDSPPESAYDDLVELAADICAAPIATITFVDESRQWFKSKVGLTASETSRDISFCAHAILGSELMIIPDALKDERFAGNPLVTGQPNIRFYAGAPLIASEGCALGTICVIDLVPRELTASQKNALKVLSRHVVTLLEMRRRAAENARINETAQVYEGAYRTLFENAEEGIFQTSPEGKYLDANPAAARMLGYDSREEILSMLTDIPRQLYVDPKRRELFKKTLEADGFINDFRAEVFRKDGSRIWIKTSARVVRDGLGKITCYQGTSQDITAQIEAERRLRASEAQYHVLFDGNPHPMWVFDQTSLRFIEVNEAAIRHYGYSREEFLAMTISDIRPAEDKPAHAAYHQRVVQGELISGLDKPIVWRHQKKDGTIIYVEVKWTAIEFKGARAQLVLANDITERHKGEFRNAALGRLAQSLSSASTAEDAARIIVQAADEVLGWDACSLDLYSPELNTTRPLLNLDLIEGCRTDVAPAYKEQSPSPRIAEVIQNGGTLILRNAGTKASAPELRPFGDIGRQAASLLFVPIRNLSRVIGILSIQSYKANAYSETSLGILQTLADQCGGALERIDAEEKLAKERNLLRTLLDHLPDYIFLKDLQSRHLLVNKAHARFRGLADPNDVIGHTLFDRMPRDIAEKFLRDDQNVLQTGQSLIDHEEKIVDKDGNVHWLLTTKVPLRDKDKNIFGLVGISRDITERKRIEAALRETQEMFQLISENVSDLIAVVDCNGQRLYNSPSYARIFDDPALLQGTDSFAQIHPEDIDRVRAVFENTLRTGVGQRTEYRFLLPEGKIRHIESQGSFVRGDSPEQNKVVVVSRDVSERKRIEQNNAALSRLDQQLSAATSPKGAARVIGETTRELFAWHCFTLNLFSIDDKIFRPLLNMDTVEGKIVELSESAASPAPSPLSRRVMDAGPQLILKKPPLAMLPDSHPIGDIQRPSASLMYVPIRHRKTVLGVLSVQSYTVDAYTERDLAALVTIADHCGGALERIRAEEALRSSEVRFQSVWESSVDGMRLTDENGVTVAVNRAYCKMVEMSAEELQGRPFTVTYADSENHEKLLQTYKQRFNDRSLAKFIESKMTFRSGKVAELEGTSSFVDLEKERPLLLRLFRDVSEQKRLEAQLRQSQKMDSIGQLAGGIAHDFNNLLTVIQGHASILLAHEKHGPTVESLKEISTAAERSANLTRQLLTFSRRQVMQLRALDFKEVVDDMTKMLRRILGEDIALRVESSSALPRIHADRGMMEQIILNLAVNSRDAMPRGGELFLGTSTVQIDTEYTRRNTDAYLGEFLCLAVSDTGCGISPETLTHIFEPFFTTKEFGKGTGLGLATVYGIVKQHEGWIEVASEVGKGACFKVFLPRSTQTTDTPDHFHPTAPLPGSETILVVEDETPLRELVQFILKGQGYNVLTASSGVAALKVWEQHKTSIDLLLTDLVMPEGMTGNELGERLVKDDPELKVIFTSGYSADTVGKDFVLRDGINFLQKPYHPDKLAQAVRDCLDRK